MRKTISHNIIYIILILLGCSKDDNSDNINNSQSLDIAIESQDNNNITLNYTFRNISEDCFLIYSKSEDLDYENYEKMIPLNKNSGTVSVTDLTYNTTYYLKVFYVKDNAPTYSNQISATTKEIVINLTTDTSVDIFPESGNFIYLMDSQLDESKNFLYLLTMQLSHYSPNNEFIELSKIDLEGNLLWKTLIQDHRSMGLASAEVNGHLIQILSDQNLGILTTSNNKKIKLTKVSTDGNIILQNEYNLINDNLLAIVTGYSYINNLMKLTIGFGNNVNAEELFLDNSGNIIHQSEFKTNSSDQWIMNAKYNDDGTFFNVGIGDLHPNDGLVTYEGLIEKISLGAGTYTNIFRNLYGEYGGDDSFDRFTIKDNHIYSNGYYGNSSGFDDKQKWIVKFNSNGEKIWENKSKIKKDFLYHGRDIFINSNDDLLSLMHEMYYPNAPVYDITSLSKFNKNGDLIWVYEDGEEFNTESFSSNKVFEINNKEYIITGGNSSDVGTVWIKKILIE